jgi:uncharacterized phage protein (predicted DNA packaging)
MAYVTLAEAKKHLYVDDFFLDDDTYITSLIEAAECTVERQICHTLSDHVDPDGRLHPPLRQAILLMVGHYYSNREPVTFGVSMHEVPMSARYLTELYRDYKG